MTPDVNERLANLEVTREDHERRLLLLEQGYELLIRLDERFAGVADSVTRMERDINSIATSFGVQVTDVKGEVKSAKRYLFGATVSFILLLIGVIVSQ